MTRNKVFNSLKPSDVICLHAVGLANHNAPMVMPAGNCLSCSAGFTCIWELALVTTVPADVLALNRARTSAGTVMIVISIFIFQVFLAINDFAKHYVDQMNSFKTINKIFMKSFGTSSISSSSAVDWIFWLWGSIPYLLIHYLLKLPEHQQAWLG